MMNISPSPTTSWRTVIFGSALSAVMIAGVVLVLRYWVERPAQTLASAAPPAAETRVAEARVAEKRVAEKRVAETGVAETGAAETGAARQPAPPKPAPDYDVVLVSPQGDAVLAGRATPGARIVVRDGTDGSVLGEASANARGEWVLTPDTTIAAGPHTLLLEEHLPDGTVLKAPGPALVSVPERGQGQALAVVAPEGGVPRVVGGGAAVVDRPVLDALSYGTGSGLSLRGRAPAGASLRLYADGAAIGDARADGTGGWSFAHRLALSPGQHRLRIDMLDAGGKVLARAEVPFEAAGGGSGGPVTVRPGQSLWRIAEAAYGDGVRYVEIFAANRGQISDPNLIYPGQVFALPPAALPQGSIPASSSQSR